MYIFDTILYNVILNMPELKYKNEIINYAGKECPPKNCGDSTIKAYRYVKSPIAEKDFIPYINDKTKTLPRATEKNHLKFCQYCGLSMYSTLENARKKYIDIPKKSNITYTHIAEGELDKTIGVYHPNNPSGHFTFYEFENVNLLNRFTIIEELKK
jgi:hypothetical protein